MSLDWIDFEDRWCVITTRVRVIIRYCPKYGTVTNVKRMKRAGIRWAHARTIDFAPFSMRLGMLRLPGFQQD